MIKLIEMYRELKNIINNAYEIDWYTIDIEKAIIEIDYNKFTDKELEPEYENMRALRNFALKRIMISDTESFRFYISKKFGIARTTIVLDKSDIGENEPVDIRIPHNINRLQFSNKLVKYITNFETDKKVSLYIKSLKQLDQDYTLIEQALDEGILKIYEDNILLSKAQVSTRLEMN